MTTPGQLESESEDGHRVNPGKRQLGPPNPLDAVKDAKTKFAHGPDDHDSRNEATLPSRELHLVRHPSRMPDAPADVQRQIADLGGAA